MALAISFSACSEEDESTCENDSDFCDTGDTSEIVTACVDEDGNRTYMIGDQNYDTLAEVNAALQCSSSVSDSRIMEKLLALDARLN